MQLMYNIACENGPISVFTQGISTISIALNP
jgi:hypothetical protein